MARKTSLGTACTGINQIPYLCRTQAENFIQSDGRSARFFTSFLTIFGFNFLQWWPVANVSMVNISRQPQFLPAINSTKANSILWTDV